MAGNSVWDEFEFDPRSAPNGALRASDADRDVAHQALGRAYAEGRLTREEFDQRSESVLGVRTLAEFCALLADLVPVAGAPARVGSGDDRGALQARAVAKYRSDLREASWSFLSVSTIVWVIWAVTGSGFPWPIFVTLAMGLNVGRLLVMRTDETEKRRLELDGEERSEIEKRRQEREREQHRRIEEE